MRCVVDIRPPLKVRLAGLWTELQLLVIMVACCLVLS